MKRGLLLAVCLLVCLGFASQALAVTKDGVVMSPMAGEKDRYAPAGPRGHFGDNRSYCEGFEAGVPPAGWTLVQNNPYTWYQGYVSPYEGYYYAQCDYDADYTGPQDEFLKFTQLVTATESHLNFAMMGSYYWSTAPYANYDMYVTIDGTRVWTWTVARTPGGSELNWVYEVFDIDLTTYIGQTIEIGFEYAGYDGAEGAVDGVCVNEGYIPPPVGACCDPLGGCILVQESACYAPSIWHGDWDCVVNQCPAPPVPVNDVCATALPLPCGPFSIGGTTLGAYNDYTPASSSCTGFSQALGPDVVYYVDLVVGNVITVTMSTGGLWDDALYLVTDCGNMASCVAGDDQYPDGSTFTYVVPAGGAGRYYLIVDGYGPSGYGAFTISGTIDCTPPVPVESTSWGSLKNKYR
jgi:hypothetical protein